MLSVEELRDQVLALSPEERATLMEDLLSSLALSEQQLIENAWFTLAQERLDAYRRGETKSISLEESKARIFER